MKVLICEEQGNYVIWLYSFTTHNGCTCVPTNSAVPFSPWFACVYVCTCLKCKSEDNLRCCFSGAIYPPLSFLFLFLRHSFLNKIPNFFFSLFESGMSKPLDMVRPETVDSVKPRRQVTCFQDTMTGQSQEEFHQKGDIFLIDSWGISHHVAQSPTHFPVLPYLPSILVICPHQKKIKIKKKIHLPLWAWPQDLGDKSITGLE